MGRAIDAASANIEWLIGELEKHGNHADARLLSLSVEVLREGQDAPASDSQRELEALQIRYQSVLADCGALKAENYRLRNELFGKAVEIEEPVAESEPPPSACPREPEPKDANTAPVSQDIEHSKAHVRMHCNPIPSLSSLSTASFMDAYRLRRDNALGWKNIASSIGVAPTSFGLIGYKIDQLIEGYRAMKSDWQREWFDQLLEESIEKNRKAAA